ncbi:hypothetical protein MHBO_005310 [Bonamia ostreae]|uniref:Reverse transcriptase domain-containing protein n=1 Tax=Bonamia ostreae TaxID=126728 RepID=A0ABV2AMM9_9EUKA
MKDIREKIRRKNKALRNYRKDRCPENKKILRNLSQEIKKHIKEAKRKYWDKITSKMNSKDVHRLFRHLLGKKKSTKKLEKITEDNIASTFGYTDGERSHNDKHDSGSPRWKSHTTNFIKYENCREIIKSLAKNKAPGIDGINNFMIQFGGEFLCEKITDLYNRMFDARWYPMEWNEAIVVPIPKGNKKITCENLRPISLLPGFAKIFEKLILMKLCKMENFMNVIPKNQYGFIRGLSTREPLQILKSDILSNIHFRKSTFAVFVDLTKAYDSVNRDKLTRKIALKLRESETEQKIFGFIEHFLGRRKLRIRVNGEHGKMFEAKSGVPQGSPLSPLLFNYYSADLLKTDCKSLGYADDIVLYAEGPNKIDCEHAIENSITYFAETCKQLELKISYKKTKAVYFTRSRSKYEKNFNFDGKQIEIVEKFQYLGVELDNKLTMKNHIDTLRSKTRRACSAIYYLGRSLGGLNTRQYLMLFKTHVQPKIDYGSEVVLGSCKTNIDRIRATEHRTLTAVIGVDKGCSKQEALSISECIQTETRWALRASKFFGELLLKHREIFNRIISKKNHGFSRKTQAVKATERILQDFGYVQIANEKLIKKLIKQKMIKSTIERLEKKEYRKLMVRFLQTNQSLYASKNNRFEDVLTTKILLERLPFQKLLKSRNKSSSEMCKTCQKVDTAQHKIFECEQLDENRKLYLGERRLTNIDRQVDLLLKKRKACAKMAWLALETLR